MIVRTTLDHISASASTNSASFVAHNISKPQSVDIRSRLKIWELRRNSKSLVPPTLFPQLLIPPLLLVVRRV